ATAPALIAVAVLPLLAGAAIAAQAALNGRVREASGSLLATTVVNGLVGSVAVLAAAAVWFGVRGLPSAALPSSPWFYAGGALGLGVTAASAAVVRHIGVLLLGLAMIAGQSAGALALDVVVPGRAGPPTLTTFVGVALTVAAVALAARRPRV
ncbi:MAG: EamA-like transporter family protein, partial [Hamadaea sp.]|nr:EamA-like transporter family protein [Hamadaea sp.]